MIFKKSELEGYGFFESVQFIPVNIWNKQKKLPNGKIVEAGKHPLHDDWPTKQYKKYAYLKWMKSGYNLGYRIKENEAVIDLDPRNYEGKDIENIIAELLGFFEFEELLWGQVPIVKTGGGGYHIYVTLPFEVDYKSLRETIEELPGVELKKKGRQVLCPGSKHPNGKYYKWINQCKPIELTKQFIKKFERVINNKNNRSESDYFSGKGALTGPQLKSLILDKLDPTEYDSDSKWYPLLCGSHHVTGGEGIDEFVEWSLQDENYKEDESVIRNRWDSLGDDKENNITVGTLIGQLKQKGEDTSQVKAIINFSKTVEDEEWDDDQEDRSDDKEHNIEIYSEKELLENAKEISTKIDVSDILQENDEEAGVEGQALKFATNLNPNASNEDIMKCLRLIKVASKIESEKAKQVLADRKILKKGVITAILKDLDRKINDDLALVISEKTLDSIFNKGKHITNTPGGQLWVYKKTHWVQISDEFLGKLVQKVVHNIKDKLQIQAQELSLIAQAVKLTRIATSTLVDRIHRTGPPLSVVNCKNGELWMNEDGSHILKSHNYRSYLINCLNVDYDPSAQCPLFIQTLEEIFRDYEDTQDIIRHLGEVFGYIIQPRKNIAAWWLFKGPGGDGKSTLAKILGSILQDAQLAGSVKLLELNSENGDNHASHSLVGKLNLVVEELPHKYVLKDSTLKMLSENTKMEANPKNRDRYNFIYCGTLIMCSNRFPRSNDFTHAMTRRANVILFNRRFTESGEEDLNRVNRILNNPEEMSGILNFMLEGLQRLRDRGRFDPPKSCRLAKEAWLEQSNNLIRFVKENIELTKKEDDFVGSLKDIYEMRYTFWCQENDIDQNLRLKKSNFKLGLEELGLVVERSSKHSNKIMISGGKLTEDLSDEFEEEW